MQGPECVVCVGGCVGRGGGDGGWKGIDGNSYFSL